MKLVALLLVLIALPAAAQSGPVLLRWNVPPDSGLAFLMTTQNAAPPASGDLFSRLPQPERSEMTTGLRLRPDGEIDVTLTPGAASFANDTLAAMYDASRALQEARGALVLHARMTAAGRVIPDDLRQEQVNVVALHFELPGGPVSVGDAWTLDGVRMLSLSGGAQPTDSSRTGDVRLVALEGTPEAPVAVLDYDLHERLVSSYGTMTFGFTGRGLFDVAAGTWRRVDARMRLELPAMLSDSPEVIDQVVVLEPVRADP